MKLAVTDSNIFIDLIHVDLIDHLFSLDHEIHTCIEVYDELNERQQTILDGFKQQEKLNIHALNSEEQDLVNDPALPRSLSITDASVIFIAKKLNASILTGDGPLRKHSIKLRFEVHGILWLFNCFHERKLISAQECIEKLIALIAYNERLPKQECDDLIKKWSNIL